MIKPSIDVLLSKVDSKYSLVVAAAKRARSLVDGEPSTLTGNYSNKPVSRALHEIGADTISYERTKTGIK